MATASVTKFYPCGSDAPYVPSTFRGSWVSNPPRTATLADDKTGEHVLPLGTGSVAPGSNARGIARFVSNPLAAQTIAGTLNMAFNVQESNADCNYFTKVYLYVTAGDSDTVRGTLLDFADTGGTEWATTSFGAVYAFSVSQLLTTLVVQDGDRIVCEFGCVAVAGSGSARTGTAWFGSTNRVFDGTLLPDAVVGATGTGVTAAGFFEFSAAIDVQRNVPASGDLFVGNQSLYLYDGSTGVLKRRILPIGSEDPAGGAEANGRLYVSYESLNAGDDPENGQVALYNPTTLAYQGLFQTFPGVGPHSISPNRVGDLFVGFTGENTGIDQGGLSCGENASTAEATFTRTATGVTTMATAATDLSVLVSVEVMQTFANGDGAQPTFKIGTNVDDDLFAPASTFTNAVIGTTYSFQQSVASGQGIRVTAVAATGSTSTGSLFVRVVGLLQMTASTYAVRKYDASGALVATFTVAGEMGGSNAIDLSSDQSTLYYTSLGRLIKRYDVVADVQLSDFCTLPPAVDGEIARGLRILPDGSVLVVDTLNIKRISSDGGSILQTYSVGGQEDWGTLSLSPDGTQFWVANRADGAVSAPMICKFAVSTGDLLLQIDENDVSLPDTGGGMCSGGITCLGGYRAAQGGLQPTSGPLALQDLRASGRLGDSNVVRIRRAPHMSNEQERVFHKSFQLDCEVGVGVPSGQGSDPTVELRWSNDGGYTFSAWRTLTVGRQGEYRARAIAFILGNARDRVYEVRQSDPVRTAWLAAYLDVEGENRG